MPRTATKAGWDELVGYLARQLGDPSLAEQLAQEAWLRLAGLGDGVVVLDQRAYLFTIARRLVIDHWRVHAVRPAFVQAEDLELQATPEADPEAALLSREEIAVLTRAIDALPPRTREVFRLHKSEHMSHEAIAAQLGMARNTVMVHMVKALGACRAALRAHRAGG
jgi:RNA polymerase sigma-70 factor (ECF subfamily)